MDAGDGGAVGCSVLARWTLLLLLGCTSDVRLEAERALAGGEHVRLLTLADQREAVRVLESLTCADRDVCRVKEACLEVARPSLAGFEHREAGLAAAAVWYGDAGLDVREPARERADELLGKAHDELEAGKNAVPGCEAGLAVLARSVKGK